MSNDNEESGCGCLILIILALVCMSTCSDTDDLKKENEDLRNRVHELERNP